MPPLTYSQRVRRVLQTLVHNGTITASLDQLVNGVIADKRASAEPVATNHRFFIWRVLRSEAQAEHIELRGDRAEATVSVTAIGTEYYKQPQGPTPANANPLAHEALPLGRNAVQQSERNKERAEYMRLAGIIEHTIKAFEGHEPPALLLDPKNLPQLIRDNIETISHLEAQNQEAIENIQWVADHIDYLLG
ncbi:hypothetical protein BV20DRAFT_1054667 [Pilatotrama ljubarskyi]|nr:hypothetical protein BV20DRAFT_1054667 [Pilatotrama ljubarskyi]